jgi:hypothetical protein
LCTITPGPTDASSAESDDVETVLSAFAPVGGSGTLVWGSILHANLSLPPAAELLGGC